MTKRRMSPEDRSNLIWAITCTVIAILFFWFVIMSPLPQYAL